MYIPAAFAETDLETLGAFVDAHPLATVALVVDGGAHVDHIPFMRTTPLAVGGSLIAHVAQGNPTWRHVGDGLSSPGIHRGVGLRIAVVISIEKGNASSGSNLELRDSPSAWAIALSSRCRIQARHRRQTDASYGIHASRPVVDHRCSGGLHREDATGNRRSTVRDRAYRSQVQSEPEPSGSGSTRCRRGTVGRSCNDRSRCTCCVSARKGPERLIVAPILLSRDKFVTISF